MCRNKWEKTKTTARYYLLLLFYFTEERILTACNKKMTKLSSHTAIVINNYEDTLREVRKISEVAANCILTGTKVVTIFEQKGKLSQEKEIVAKSIIRCLEQVLQRHKGTAQLIQNKEDDKLLRIEMQKEGGNSEKEEILVNFITEEDNKEVLLKLIKERGQELKHKKDDTRILEKKQNYDRIEAYLHQNLSCYQKIPNDKNVSINPQMILVFNSYRRILQLKGFPMLMKEIAEIFECGNLLEYRIIDFVRNLERYSQIEQRWGI